MTVAVDILLFVLIIGGILGLRYMLLREIRACNKEIDKLNKTVNDLVSSQRNWVRFVSDFYQEHRRDQKNQEINSHRQGQEIRRIHLRRT